jgi:cell division protein FtsW
LFYLPEAHTDFIFSVIGEELGLVGVMFVISLFAVFCYRGLRIALNAPDLFGRYIALGCTALISLQAILNMAVVMGLLPTKGLALPFISYGGSSLVVSLLVVGLLLNVSSYRSAD